MKRNMYILHLLKALRSKGISVRIALSKEQMAETTFLKGLKKYPSVIVFSVGMGEKRLTVMNPDEIIGVLLALCTVFLSNEEREEFLNE